MTDDELERALATAHRDDDPPPLRALLARPRRPRRAWLAALPAVVAAAGVILALALRPHRAPPAPLARVDVTWRAPLDFLLDVPGADLVRATPRFDLKGLLP